MKDTLQMQANPDLIPAGSTNNLSVPAATKFRHVNDRGEVIAESTAPLPSTRATVSKAYTSSVHTTSFHRADGKKLPFIYGFFETDILHDQLYLDNEIDAGNRYVRLATAEEIEIAHMRNDPHGTMRKKVEAELANDPSIIQGLEEKIRSELLAKFASGELQVPADAEKIAGVDKSAVAGAGAKVEGATVSVVQPSLAHRLGGIQSTADIEKGAVTSGR